MRREPEGSAAARRNDASETCLHLNRELPYGKALDKLPTMWCGVVAVLESKLGTGHTLTYHHQTLHPAMYNKES